MKVSKRNDFQLGNHVNFLAQLQHNSFKNSSEPNRVDKYLVEQSSIANYYF